MTHVLSVMIGYRLGSDEVPSEKVTSSDDTPAQEEALPLVRSWYEQVKIVIFIISI
jgi:hypothetical protein